MVHSFSLKGYRIAVDANTGNIFQLDEVSYALLKVFPGGLPTEEQAIREIGSRFPVGMIREAYGELKELAAAGLLYTPELDEASLGEAIYAGRGLKALCLHVAHDCNLRCAYCFAAKGDYRGGRRLMPFAVARRALDFLIENSGDRREIEVDFFGGEPLLNMDVVKQVVAYGKERAAESGKNIHFTLTTNGTLLNEEIIEFLNEHMDNVVISLDGRPEVHDAKRYDITGRGSFDRICPQALRLVERRGAKSYFIRGTFTADNLDFANDVLFLADLGFREISIEPVVGTGAPFYLRQEDLPAILVEYEHLAEAVLLREAQGKGFRFYHFQLDLYKGPCLVRRIHGCGAGVEYLAVSPEGDLYPCHQFVSEDSFKMGDLQRGIIREDIREDFLKTNILTVKNCQECWAKLFCSGGCHAHAYFTHRDLRRPNELTCAMTRKRIECAIMLRLAGIELEQSQDIGPWGPLRGG
ncbi:MAG: thioether cross-link-forming SCIFF peptide maturase [Bacillota bacterium]